ncbi:MAG: hypothetical protein HXY36_05780 [Chloroflexi bacterium]|nr:hypothetical protein [Chloroflexota bacterium]
MAEEKKKLWSRRPSPAWVGPVWFIGWLFTVGYAHLVWWQILLALIVWPYFLGRAVGG